MLQAVIGMLCGVGLYFVLADAFKMTMKRKNMLAVFSLIAVINLPV